MKSKPDLALDFSSIGGSIRLKKQRLGVGPSESMDSSGSSLDLTAEVGNFSREDVDLALSSTEVGEFPPVGPLSSIGVDEVANWRAKYNLSDDDVIRIPGPIDRVSDFKVDEVPVYEGFFESGFRYRVPSLVAKVSEALEISPGQLNPPSWRTLIALQNLGVLEGLTIGVVEGLHTYAITRLNGGEQIYHLHPRGRELPVQEIAKKIESASRLSMVTGPRKIHCVDPSLERRRSSRYWNSSIERPQVPFLVSKEALEHCSIWGNMSGSKGEEALPEYKRALEVMSAKKAAPKKVAPSENDDESRALGSTPMVSPTSSNDPATVLANLNTKVFPLTPVILPEGDSFAPIQLIQGDILQAMSQLFHLGERMDEHASLKAYLAELTSQLREDKNKILAKEKEIKALKLKVRNQDEAGALAAAENVSLREQLEQREEEVCNLRGVAEIFDAEKNMAVNGVIVVARWELMKEWLNHQTDSWDLEGPLEQYKMLKTSEAEYQGLPAPTFEGEPSLPSGTETEKPVADDPPAS
ncbi:hypothetical protein IGI04_042847 [Brassica rapa subsp. trilocularis]|uniref:Uncharacterized protein n=1 Tax=Brassica rapa subsp. trilocularis TaxID=1813537 RepID=A0ABQ7KIB2_BRACM|nr:hypothetical protein IGI04_042847 [Brassica rapa subsp. trilocularis]